MVTSSVTPGRALAGWMSHGPGAGRSKVIVSAPGFALASRIAWRSDPGPESAVVVTAKVVGAAPAGVATSTGSVTATTSVAMTAEIFCRMAHPDRLGGPYERAPLPGNT